MTAPVSGSPIGKPPEKWALRPIIRLRTIALAAAAACLLAVSAHHTQMDRLVGMGGEAALHAVGLAPESSVARGTSRFLSLWWPPAVSDATPVSRIEGFDRSRLPLFSHLEMQESSEATYDYDQKTTVVRTRREEVLVRPLGYLVFVFGKMLESLEMALWGTLLGIGLGAPLAYLAARTTSPLALLRGASRSISGLLRAVPELVSVLFLVLTFGVGPIAGVLALGLHSAGFFGKFYADDVENADPRPLEALMGLGVGRFKVLWFAALPQVLPQFASYTQYILERNVRMATVIGVVGAGGIGIELKGRFDMYDFSHVTTIVAVILAAVLTLERLSQWARYKLM